MCPDGFYLDECRDPDWEFFLPDDEVVYPDEGDFWIDDDDWPEEA